ncbi:hypothetical protein PQX77_000367 [Marasmius sp. AFHP31]|nr:hypothetical protein PQX77_000367 [Marasmius sp. AFHP31]
MSPMTGAVSPSQPMGSYPQVPRLQVGSPAVTDAAIAHRTKVPMFSCDVPGCTSKGFTERHNLMYHMRSHQGIRPYKCYKCDKGFLSSSDLNRHLTKAKRPCNERGNAGPNHYLDAPSY